MRITRRDDVPLDTSPDPNFRGSAERRPFGPTHALPGRPSAFLVTFRNGARTRWHSHASGQLLYVVEGTGLVATRNGGIERMDVGDVVEAAPDEEHWHGAGPDADLTHLALSFGETTWFDEPDDRLV